MGDTSARDARCSKNARFSSKFTLQAASKRLAIERLIESCQRAARLLRENPHWCREHWRDCAHDFGVDLAVLERYLREAEECRRQILRRYGVGNKTFNLEFLDRCQGGSFQADLEEMEDTYLYRGLAKAYTTLLLALCNNAAHSPESDVCRVAETFGVTLAHVDKLLERWGNSNSKKLSGYKPILRGLQRLRGVLLR